MTTYQYIIEQELIEKFKEELLEGKITQQDYDTLV
jgi:hypothetical protein